MWAMAGLQLLLLRCLAPELVSSSCARVSAISDGVRNVAFLQTEQEVPAMPCEANNSKRSQ